MSDRWEPRPRGPQAPRRAARPAGSRPGDRDADGRERRRSTRPGPDARPRERGVPARSSRPSRPATLAVGPGRPWPLVVGGAVVITGVLASLLVHRGGLLGLLLPVGYLLVCVLAVAMVRAGDVAVPALAPPVTAFLGLVIAAMVSGDTSSAAVFGLAVVVPLADLFWWVLGATLASLAAAFLRSRSPRPEPSGRAPSRRVGAA